MTKYLLITSLLIFNFSFGQTQKRTTDEEKLTKCILEHTNYFVFNGKEPVGKGWDILDSLFYQNQFVAWGEYHNSPLLSQLTAYTLGSASKYGFHTWCVETSPFIASELLKFAKSKNTTDTILHIAEKYGIPFFRTKEDASMLVAVNKFNYTIWGIDQEFQITFPYCITTVFNSQPKNVKQKYQAVYDSLIAKWWWPSDQLLDSLKNGIINQKFMSLLDDVKIGKHQMNDDDNILRASIMKSNFFQYYDKLKTRDQKIFFKMGNNHLARGMNLETNLYDIGNSVFELSQRNKTKFANVYLMVRYTVEKEKIIDDFEEVNNQNPKVFSKLYDKEKWVLVDLRTLRLKMRYDNSISSDTYKLIEKYDYVLLSPEILK